MRDETRAHYDRLASVYDQNWAYSQDFLEWMSRCVLARLRVNHGDRIMDVGCGTGLYARRLADQTGSVVCVDPSVRILEAIHHVTDRAAGIEGLAKLLAPDGHFLVVMLPTSIEYPLFQAAHDRFRELQPDPRDIAAAMSDT